MTQEEKQLLLKDLCARLPYGVKINIKSDYTREMEDTELIPYHLDGLGYNAEYRNLRPYLRPMSSMTEKDMDKLNQYVGGDRFIFKEGVISVDENFYQEGCLYSDHEDYVDIIDWLNAHHFDYRGLIEKGLALEAPEDMHKQ